VTPVAAGYRVRSVTGFLSSDKVHNLDEKTRTYHFRFHVGVFPIFQDVNNTRRFITPRRQRILLLQSAHFLVTHFEMNSGKNVLL
jgi:hypothetical protein